MRLWDRDVSVPCTEERSSGGDSHFPRVSVRSRPATPSIRPAPRRCQSWSDHNSSLMGFTVESRCAVGHTLCVCIQARSIHPAACMDYMCRKRSLCTTRQSIDSLPRTSHHRPVVRLLLRKHRRLFIFLYFIRFTTKLILLANDEY